MIIEESVPISSLTTMQLGGPARYVYVAKDQDDVREAWQFARERNLPVWMMGGGANTIGRDEGFDGVIILNQIKGIFVKVGEDLVEVEDLDDVQDLGEELELVCMGGEVWDDVVNFACERGYTGIEAMSMIPGTVGAAPVQNIGAYGQDVAQVIVSAEVYDTQTDDFMTMTKDEMQLSYRHTRFNHGADAGRFLIVAATIKLHKGEMQPPFYNSLQRYIDEHEVTDLSPMKIREIVCEIRNAKLPDPKEVASAGSFFKNIQLDRAQADDAEAKNIPVWRNPDGTGKVNSGWLIEQCGLKGKELYGFRVSDKAALVLINEKAKSYSDLAKARDEIRKAVREKFGYELEQEPVELKA